MIGKLVGIGLLMLAAFPAAAADRVNLYFCDGCSVEQEREMVKGLTGEMGTFDFYVGNFPAQTIHKYQLSRGWSQPPCSNRPGDPNCNQEMTVPTLTAQPTWARATVETYVYNKEVEQPYLEAYQYLVQFYYTEPMGFSKVYEFQIIDPSNVTSMSYQKFYKNGNFLPQKNIGVLGNPIDPVVDYPDPTMTVFDIANPGTKRGVLLDTVRNTMMQRVNIAMDNVAKVLSTLGIIDSSKLPNIGVIVHFADGGQVTLRLNNNDTVPVYEIVEDSLRDSHGNYVPVKKVQLESGPWDFDYTGTGRAKDAADMRYQLEFLGAGVQEIYIAPQWRCGTVNIQGTVSVTCLPR